MWLSSHESLRIHFVDYFKAQRNDQEWNQSDDEIINENLEKQAQNAKISSVPSKLKATIKFGYEDTMKEWLGSQDFDSWIQAPLVHAQAIYKHRSLGTEIEFEVKALRCRFHCYN